MQAPQIPLTALIAKAPEILDTQVAKDISADARKTVLTEEGRKGVLNTVKDAAGTVLNVTQNVAETGSDLTGRWLFNYTSPKTKEDKALIAALVEYKKAYSSSGDKAAEAKYWDSIGKSSQKSPVDMNKATETLAAARSSNAITGSYEGIMAESITGGNGANSASNITIAIMILSVIFIISLIYIALMSSKNITNKEQTITKNIIIVTGLLIVVLGIYKHI